MALTNEHVGPMILAKIKIYVFTRAELLIQVCYETPCNSNLVFSDLVLPTLIRYVLDLVSLIQFFINSIVQFIFFPLI